MKKLMAVITAFIMCLILTACNQTESSSITVYAPDGAPALALSYAMSSNIEGVDYKIVGAEVIKTTVTGTDKKADVAILPINDATKLLGSGEDYKLLGVVTHGNFYFLSKDNTVITKENANLLIGKTIGVIQLAKIPGLTLKASLEGLNIPYKELVGAGEKASDKANLIAITPNQIGAQDIDYYMCPSPVADLKAKALSLNFVGSLSSIYNESGFPQAVIVAKNTVITENLQKVKAVISKIKESENYLIEENFSSILTTISSNLEEGLTPSFNQNNLTVESINRSKIKFVSAKEAKVEIQNFIDKINSISPEVMGNTNDNFYYIGEF